jgi:hypothetical protein
VRWPRPRISLGQMMIAVALSPIVLYAGLWAGLNWGTMVSVTSSPPAITFAPPVPVAREATTNQLPTTVEWIEIVEIDFSTGAALLAMAATTAVLAALWVLVVRWCLRKKRKSPPEDDGRVDVADPPE